ncbi:MAG: hypothetical protein CMF94_04315 [Candidatus Marinimicrobia bacterium]|nr:hypothetical protein [Candidatus Neomarinimicrobiota bacterium]
MIKNITVLTLLIFNISLSSTYFVPGDFGSIQEAIDESVNGDSIFVDPGIYFENINFNGKSIILSSRYILDSDSLLIGTTIIDAGSDGSVVSFNSEENSSSILQGFTLQNGNGNNEDPDGNGSFYTYGGGVYCENADPLIKDCIIQNNTANEGGGAGIFCYESSPTFIGCTIKQNETDDVGGGLYARDGSSPSFFNCTFFDNLAEFGGGCYLKSTSTPYMENVLFIQNTANNSGGGMGLKDNADIEGINLHISQNIAEGLGGGIYINNADPVLSFALISDNTASSGGGIYIRNNSEIDLTNLTMANNNAGLYGSGIYMRDNSIVNLLNSILWNNSSSQIYFRSEGQEVELNVSYSIVEQNQDGIETNNNGDLNWLEGNLDSEPYFCASSAGNYYVRENSPVLNGGLDGSLVGCLYAGCGPVNLGPVWYVDSNGDNTSDGSLETPFETIAWAVSAASNGDTIRLNPGVYTGLIEFEGKNLVLESRAFELIDSTIIAETFFGPGPVGGSCLSLEGLDDENITIRGISFRGGSDPVGGGIVISNCSPTFENIIIEENTAEIGGGIYLSNSNSAFNNITVRNNGGNLGGGIYITGGAPTFTNVFIVDNIAYWGGGIYSENSNVEIDSSIIRGNEAFIEGAGYYQNGGAGYINLTSFENNNGFDYGGGIVSYQATIDLSYTTFAQNTAGIGSAMSLHSSVITINNSIIWGNYGPLFHAPITSGLTSLEIGFSNIEGGEIFLSSLENIVFNSSGGIINVDPEFCDPNNNQFSLQEDSFCMTASDELSPIGAFDIPCENLANDEILANDYDLLSSYPNPFNYQAIISYSLLEEGTYSISIYNLKGQLVKNILSESKGEGFYKVAWDGTNNFGQKVVSGVYFCRLETIYGAYDTKMILLK